MGRDNRHDTAYIFGAICPDRGVGAAIITPAANAECMNLHLAEISSQVAPGLIAAVICDGTNAAPTLNCQTTSCSCRPDPGFDYVRGGSYKTSPIVQ
jgi:hypothetical protein